MEGLQNTQFTFSNKENAHIPQKTQPKTPRQSKSIIFKTKVPVFSDALTTPTGDSKNKPSKRVPLGGKDKNATHAHTQKNAAPVMDRGLHLSASAKKRARRLRTPLGKGVNRKLDILRDVDCEPSTGSKGLQTMDLPFTRRRSSAAADDDDDDEIEHVAVKQPELPYIPLNYTPFTDEDLEVLRQSPSARLDDKTDMLSDVGSSDAELSVNFDFDNYNDEDFNFEQKRTRSGLPHFMEPTFVSNAKRVSKVDVYQDGLTSADLQRLIDEQ